MERQPVAKVQKMPIGNNHPQRQSARSSSSGHPLLELQRSVGNQTLQSLIGSPFIQRKLQVSTPGDPSEQEADRVADTVMRMPEATVSRQAVIQPTSSHITPLVQRETDRPDEEDKIVAPKSKSRIPVAVREDDEEEKVAPKLIHRMCTECEEENEEPTGAMLDRKAASGLLTDDVPQGEQVQAQMAQSTAPKLTTSLATNIHAMNGGGSPLPDTTRAFFEPRFGADLSRVRVHTDSRAAETANTINARAFTVGQNIAFGTGLYSPHSTEGRQLLAHELTHVVQQSGAAQLSTDEVARRSSPAPFVTAVQTDMVQRDKTKPSGKAKKPNFDLGAMETIKTTAETRHDSITNFIRESRGTLQMYKIRLLRAATLYKTAFSRHKAVLDKAKEAAADRKDMISKIAGFVVGVALGVPGNIARIGLTALAQRAATAFAVGSELVELAVGTAAVRAAGGPDVDAFAPTAEIPELKELAVWQTIAEMSDKLLVISLLTAKQMKIVSAAGTAITEISLREGGAKNLKKTDAELLALVNALKSADETSTEVAVGLQDAKAEIDELGAGPARQMSVDEVEQDIWIEWIAKLTDDDLLDEDDITDHLEKLNVIGEGRIYLDEDGGWYRERPRLNVDFGSWVSDEDEEDAVAAARAKLGMHVPTSTGEYYYDDD